MENKALNDIKICDVEMLVERPSPQRRPLLAAFFVEMGGQGSDLFNPISPPFPQERGLVASLRLHACGPHLSGLWGNIGKFDVYLLFVINFTHDDETG